MNTLIIWQADPKMGLTLQPLTQLGSGLVQVQGFQIEVWQIPERTDSKGRHVDGIDIYYKINDFAKKITDVVPNDIVRFQIIFMFHQTDRAIVKAITKAMESLEATRSLQALEFAANKHIHVTRVVFLSCESGGDRAIAPPIPTRHQRWIQQATDMRDLAVRAFRTLKAPPEPSQGYYRPTVVTFSTGNADRGGVVLDPFNAQPRDLDGSFNDAGEWNWDSENPDVDGTATQGSMYEDAYNEDGSHSGTNESVTQAGDAGPNLMGFSSP